MVHHSLPLPPADAHFEAVLIVEAPATALTAADLPAIRARLLPLAIACGFGRVTLSHHLDDAPCYEATASEGSQAFTMLAWPWEALTPEALEATCRQRLEDFATSCTGSL